MSRSNARLLYLARHAEPDGDSAGLTSRGARQAEHLGRRLAPLSVGRITHGPLARAAETARVVAGQFEQSPALFEDEAAGDYVPHLPDRDEVPDAWADAVLSFVADVSEDEAAHGAHLGGRAIDLLAGPAGGRTATRRCRHHPRLHHRVAGTPRAGRPRLALVPA
jgi:Histidine phosphatase superfamily (branch 1)